MIRWLRRVLPWLALALAAAGLYDGWTFYSRWEYRRQAAQLRQQREAEAARRTIDMLGGGALKILGFYATPGAIARGGSARLCYGVYGAKSVRLDPPVQAIEPSVAHCLDISPAKTTVYTLTAIDEAGQGQTQQLTVHVQQ